MIKKLLEQKMTYKKKDLKDVIVVIVVIAVIRAPRNDTFLVNGNNLQNNDNKNNNNNINNNNNNNSILVDKKKDLKQLFCNRTHKTFYIFDINKISSNLTNSCDYNDSNNNKVSETNKKTLYLPLKGPKMGDVSPKSINTSRKMFMNNLLLLHHNVFIKRLLKIQEFGQEGSQ